MARVLENDGFRRVEFEEKADVYVINTCSVTDNADKECRQLVRRIQKKSPEAIVVISGCYAQLKPQEIASIPGVDLVLGAAEKFNIGSHLKEISKGDSARICSCDIEDVNIFTSSHSHHDRTRVFLKVQDGCDYNCSFCTIPLARGKSRSNTIDNVLRDIEEIANSGVKEIVLTGINLGDFGKPSLGENDRKDVFYDLLAAIDQQRAVPRIRISSIEPNLLENRIVELAANSQIIMPHFHIPLQSGSDKILGLMRRRYKRQLYAQKVGLIKTLMPHAGIGVDAITGFPGETDEDFRESAEFISELDISYLHVFTYSERANTYALELGGKVPMEKRNERTRQLRNISYRKMADFTARHAGETRKVLFEGKNKNGMMEGYTDNYIRIETLYNKDWENRIVEFNI
jgi:threonylcarbamoyladenosine tRNA methylthiotransferase MtaB